MKKRKLKKSHIKSTEEVRIQSKKDPELLRKIGPAPDWLEKIAADDRCLLCGSPAAEFTGIYEPADGGKSLGEPKGKQRFYFVPRMRKMFGIRSSRFSNSSRNYHSSLSRRSKLYPGC